MAKIEKTDEEWKAQLSEPQFQVTRKKGTERAFSGEFWDQWDTGEYRCVCCNAPLFKSTTKFDAGCGWPSFFEPTDNQAVTEVKDFSHHMERVEVICTECGAHLGHVFTDGPDPTGLRYCINSLSLNFEKK